MTPRNRRLALRALVASLAVCLLACRGEPVDVLLGADAGTDDAGRARGPFTSCLDALQRGRSGDACVAFEGADAMGCSASENCCTRTGYCESGTLVLMDECDACGVCADDASCDVGQWCVGSECSPCPLDDPPDCDVDLVPFLRNGCLTQSCLPPSECERDADCGAGASCVESLRCVCDGPGCCLQVCADDATCPPATRPPPPEGCVRACVALTCPTGFCFQTGCECGGDQWSCGEICSTQDSPDC